MNGCNHSDIPMHHLLRAHSLPVAVLAAGLSVRFGAEDKLVQRFPSGVSIAQKTLTHIQKAKQPQRWFVRPLQFQLMKQLRQAKISWSLCPKAKEGLSTTLRYACQHKDHQKRQILITLADKPFISPRLFRRFASMRIRNSIALIISRHQANQRWQPHSPPTLKALTGHHPVLFNTRICLKLKQLQKDQGIAALLHQYPLHPFLQPMTSCDISQRDIDYRAHLRTTRGFL
jgi:CTP:molybdopterin cytidylyltransferase MocA